MTIRKNFHSGPAMSAPWPGATRSFEQKTRHITTPRPHAGPAPKTADGVHGPGSGWWVVSMTIPPCAVCAAIRRVRRAAPLTSMAVNGSSSTHNGAGRPQAGQHPARCTTTESRATGTSQIPPTRPAPAPSTPEARAVRRGGRIRVLPRRQAGFEIPGGALSGRRRVGAVAHAAPGSSPCQYLAVRASPAVA